MSLRELETQLLMNGKIEGHEIERLREVLYANGKIDRQEADFLVVLHKRLQRRTPAFEQFFYQAIKDHVLTNDRISAAETEWLEQMLYAADRIDESERKFLHELKGEAKEASPEFEAMFKRCMKEPVKA